MDKRRAVWNGGVPFPLEELGPVPPAPYMRISRYKDRKGNHYEPQNKAAVDALIGRVLEVMREKQVTYVHATQLVGFEQNKPAGSVHSCFATYATAEERLRADVLAALWRRRWGFMELLLPRMAAAGRNFKAVCRGVVEAERSTVSPRVVHNMLLGKAPYVTTAQRELVYTYYPHIGA